MRIVAKKDIPLPESVVRKIDSFWRKHGQWGYAMIAQPSVTNNAFKGLKVGMCDCGLADAIAKLIEEAEKP